MSAADAAPGEGPPGSGDPAPAEPALHRTLARQLRRLGLRRDTDPSTSAWGQLLETVSTTYGEADDERYTLERSIDVSSQEMRSLHAVLSRQALQDPLTGLANRAGVLQQLDAALAARRRDGTGLALLFIDLDGFKQVNDRLGHAAGDELLVRGSERIRACLRPDDVVGRLGGDEFVVVCATEVTEDCAAVIQAVAARIGAQLVTPFRIGASDARVSASIGIAVADSAADSGEGLLQRADAAMYAAKMKGKARAVLFDASMQAEVDYGLSVRSALGGAIARQEMRLLYQPVVALATGRVEGVEALVRWERPGTAVLLPEDFIPLAEDTGLIADLDSWVVQEACERLAPWCTSGSLLSVNLSPRSLEQDGFVHALSQALHRTGVPGRALAVEVREDGLLKMTGAAEQNLDRLRRLGVRLAVDDFGTGSSSLSQLQSTPATSLKIDSTYTAQVDRDPRTAAITGAVITMAHALGLTAVAEGVERESQADVLRRYGCDSAQGWLFGAPVPADQLGAVFSVPVGGR